MVSLPLTRPTIGCPIKSERPEVPMKRRSIAIVTAALWAVALLAVLGLVVARRRAGLPTSAGQDSPAISAATRRALVEARRIVVVEGPPDDDPRGVSTWDPALTASAASAIVDDLRSEGFRRAGGSRSGRPGRRVEGPDVLGPEGAEPGLARGPRRLHADALVFVAVRSLRARPEGADALICNYEGKGWLRLPADGSKRKLAWDRSGQLRTARSPGEDAPAFRAGRGRTELAKRWGVELIGPDLAARLARARRAGDAPSSSSPTPSETR